MRLPIYVWIVVLFVFASLGIVGAFVYQNNARKAEAERRAAAVAEAERQTAQAAAEQREREEREEKDRQTKADEAERTKTLAKADAEARAKRIADEAKRKYDLMSDADRRRIDNYRQLIARHDRDAIRHVRGDSEVWFLIANEDQFAGHDIVACLTSVADEMGVDKLARSQKATGRQLLRLKIDFTQLDPSGVALTNRLVDKVNDSGIGALTDRERSFIRNRPALFPLWSR